MGEQLDRSDLYARGDEYDYMWVAYLVIPGVGIVLNLLVLASLNTINPETARQKNIRFLSTVNGISLAFCVIAVILGSIYYHDDGIPGDSACEAQSILYAWFFFLSGSIIAAAAYTNKQQICDSITSDDVIGGLSVVPAGVATALSGLFTVLSVFAPGTGFSPMSSGTWCFPQMDHEAAFAIVIIGLTLPPLAILISAWQVWSHIQEGQSILREQGVLSAVKGGRVNEMKKLALQAALNYVCLVPVLISPLYHLATGNVSPALVDLITGCIAVTKLALVDPLILMVILGNENVLRSLTPTYRKGTYQVAPADGVREDGNAVDSDKSRLHTLVLEYEMYNPEEVKQYEDWRWWIEGKKVHPELMKWSEANFVNENVMFFAEVQKYKKMGLIVEKFLENYMKNAKPESSSSPVSPVNGGHVTSPRDLPPECLFTPRINAVVGTGHINSPNNKQNPPTGPLQANQTMSQPSETYKACDEAKEGEGDAFGDMQVVRDYRKEVAELRQCKWTWEGLNRAAFRMFELYIKTPSAPLEINIDDACRKRIYSVFGVKDERQADETEVPVEERMDFNSCAVNFDAEDVEDGAFSPLNNALFQNSDAGNSRNASRRIHSAKHSASSKNSSSRRTPGSLNNSFRTALMQSVKAIGVSTGLTTSGNGSAGGFVGVGAINEPDINDLDRAPQGPTEGLRQGSASARQQNSARFSTARNGSGKLGSARFSTARNGSGKLGSARFSTARNGSGKLGSARLGSAKLGSASSSAHIRTPKERLSHKSNGSGSISLSFRQYVNGMGVRTSRSQKGGKNDKERFSFAGRLSDFDTLLSKIKGCDETTRDEIIAEVHNVVEVFNYAADLIAKTIQSDIFPRFRKTEGYKASVAEALAKKCEAECLNL
jgi:hypothetical protein